MFIYCIQLEEDDGSQALLNALKSCSVTEVYPQLDGDSSEDDDDANDDNDDDANDDNDDDNDDDTGDGDTTGAATAVKAGFLLTAVLAAAAKAYMQ